MTTTRTIVAFGAAACLAGVASAGITTESRATLDAGFTPGTGNSATNFAITRIAEESGAFAGNTVEMGIKAKERFFGDGNVGGWANVYKVQPGFSPTSGASGAPLSDDAWWNFDFSVDYGDREASNTLVTLTITDIDGDSISFPFDGTAGVPGSTDIVQGSQNVGFGFIATPLGGFDAFQMGDYTITLTAADGADGSGGTLGSVSIIARVVPMPTPLGMAGLGLMGVAGVCRRRA